MESQKNRAGHAFQFACVQFIPSENSAKCRICLRIRISDMYYSMLHLVVCQLGVLLKKHKFSIALEVSTRACPLQVIQRLSHSHEPLFLVFAAPCQKPCLQIFTRFIPNCVPQVSSRSFRHTQCGKELMPFP